MPAKRRLKLGAVVEAAITIGSIGEVQIEEVRNVETIDDAVQVAFMVDLLPDGEVGAMKRTTEGGKAMAAGKEMVGGMVVGDDIHRSNIGAAITGMVLGAERDHLHPIIEASRCITTEEDHLRLTLEVLPLLWIIQVWIEDAALLQTILRQALVEVEGDNFAAF